METSLVLIGTGIFFAFVGFFVTVYGIEKKLTEILNTLRNMLNKTGE